MEIDLVVESTDLSKTIKQRDILQTLGIKGRNERFTHEAEEKLKQEIKASHSFVPGSCKHRHSKERMPKWN
jgi:hypothetical protein